MSEPSDREARDLEELLDQLHCASNTDHHRITVRDIVIAVGTRSFAPLLLLVGILITSPLSGIPVFPTVAAIIVLLISAQMLIGRRHFWLPDWLLNRSLPRKQMLQAIDFLRPAARWVDRLIKPRLTYLVKGPALLIIAVLCTLIALAMPGLELIPFSSSMAGLALTAFGLSLVAQDGFLAIIAYAAVGSTAWLIASGLPV